MPSGTTHPRRCPTWPSNPDVRLIPTATIVISAASGIIWGVERHEAAQLQGRLDATMDREEEIVRLRHERDRLVRLQPSPGEIERLRGEVQQPGQNPEAGKDQPTIEAIELRPGAWVPASAWRNQGRSTPEAAIETMLWAAAGGNVSVIKDTLVLAPETRSRADEILAGLPDTSRQFATPEDLIALLVAGSVPLDSAQVVARQQNQDDEATEYLRLKDSGGRTRQVYLSLRKERDGWQLTVPRSAVDQMEKVPGGTSVQ